MKLSFIFPGDEVVLNKKVTLPAQKKGYFSDGADYPHFMKGIKELAKGTRLRVSQVYIRNGGWYSSSLTFALVDGPTCLEAQKAKYLLNIEREVKDLTARNDYLKKEEVKARRGLKNYAGKLLASKTKEYNAIVTKIEANKKKIAKLKANPTGKLPRLGNEVLRIPVADIEKWDVKLIRKPIR